MHKKEALNSNKPGETGLRQSILPKTHYGCRTCDAVTTIGDYVTRDNVGQLVKTINAAAESGN